MEPITLVLIGVGIFLVLLLFSSKGSSPVVPTKVSTLPPAPPASQQLNPATQQAVANALSPAVGAAVQQATTLTVPPALKAASAPAPAGFRSGPSPLEEAFQSEAPAPAGTYSDIRNLPPEQVSEAANMIMNLVNSLLDNTFTLKASEITSIQAVLRTASPPVLISDDELPRVVRYYLLKQMTPPVETQNEIFKLLTATKPTGNNQIAISVPANSLTGAAAAETLQFTVDDLRAMKALTYKWPEKYTVLMNESLLRGQGISIDVNKAMNTAAKLAIWMSGYYFGVNMLS